MVDILKEGGFEINENPKTGDRTINRSVCQECQSSTFFSELNITSFAQELADRLKGG